MDRRRRKESSPENRLACCSNLDSHVPPLLCMIIMHKHRCILRADIKQIDRTNIGNARIQGMEKDLHLQGYRFNWVLTTFYIAYTIVEIPSNIVLKKIGAKIWLPILTV